MRWILLCCTFAIAVCMVNAAAWKSRSVSDLDAKMGKEAKTFLGNMPAGLQGRQTDAVIQAIEGNNMPLNDVRSSRNSHPELPAGVTAKTVAPDMRLYYPSAMLTDGGKRPLLIYLHGGGWTFGSIWSCARFCSDLVAYSGCMVLALDYRLAPEHPYPAGLEDCIKAWKYAHDNAESWGADPGRISFGGDSSGGNLALAATMKLNAGDSAKVHSLVVFYPVTKAFCDGSSSWNEFGYGYGLDSSLMEAFNKAYLNNGSDSEDMFVSVGCAPDEALLSLPPVLMINAGKDILRDQGREFAGRLSRLGKEICHVEFPGAVHLFITVEGQPSARAEAVRLAGDFML